MELSWNMLPTDRPVIARGNNEGRPGEREGSDLSGGVH